MQLSAWDRISGLRVVAQVLLDAIAEEERRVADSPRPFLVRWSNGHSITEDAHYWQQIIERFSQRGLLQMQGPGVVIEQIADHTGRNVYDRRHYRLAEGLEK